MADPAKPIRSADERVSELEHRLEEIEREAAELRARLEERERQAALGVKLTIVAHDLKNAIGFITGSVDFLQRYLADFEDLLDAYGEIEGELGEKERAMLAELKQELHIEAIRVDAKRIVEAIREGGERSHGVVQGILDFARGRGARIAEPTDLAALVQSVIALQSLESRERVEVRFEGEPVPLVCCQGDRIRQVIENLVENAVQAISGRGCVAISLRALPGDRAVVLRVRDDGIGIGKDSLAHIFEPFFTTKPAGKGSGLGLAIVRQIVDDHGGKISVESAPSAGTTFEVTLPTQTEPSRRIG